jgi:hypothetical protein
VYFEAFGALGVDVVVPERGDFEGIDGIIFDELVDA